MVYDTDEPAFTPNRVKEIPFVRIGRVEERPLMPYRKCFFLDIIDQSNQQTKSAKDSSEVVLPSKIRTSLSL